MAYTSVIPVHRLDNTLNYTTNEKKCSRSQSEESLEGVVEEVLNRDRSERDLFLSAIGCTTDSAFADMCRVKQMWHKEKGVQGFHLVQSFAAGEVTPELAHTIGMQMAEQLLHGQFQVVVSTHLNTKCIHNHLAWNSVSLQNGRKYRSNHKIYVTEIRHLSDTLCREYGLSVIDTEKSERTARSYAQWLAEQNGQPTWKTAIQQDIDAAVTAAFTWNQFLRILEEKGYTFQLNRKYITLQPPGKERPVRFKTLGSRYTPESIRRRILYPKPPIPAGKRTPPVRYFRLQTGVLPTRRLTGLRALYFSYLYKMGALKKKPRHVSFAVREDIRRLDQRIEQMEFVFKNRIEDRGQLAEIRQEAESQIAALIKERQRLYRYESGSPQIDTLTRQLKQLRHTAKLCRNIEVQSLEMEKRLRAVWQAEQQRRERKQQPTRTQAERRR